MAWKVGLHRVQAICPLHDHQFPDVLFRLILNYYGTASIEELGVGSFPNQTPKPLKPIVHLKQIEYGVYGDLIVIYARPYSIDLRGL